MILLWTGLAAAACPELDPGQTHFALKPTDLPPVPLVLELRGPPEGLEPLLQGLETRGVGATIVFDSPREAAGWMSLAERGHELALRLDTAEWDATHGTWSSELRSNGKAWKRATQQPLKTVVVSSIPRPGELAANQQRLETVLVEAPGRAHLAPSLDGSHGRTLVMPQSQLCTEQLGELHRAQLDELAAGLQAVPTKLELALRVPLVSSELDPSEQELLLAWLDEVALPSGAVVRTAAQLEPRLPTRRVPDAQRPEGVRPVDVAELRRAGQALLEAGERLPAELPGPLTPTELYLGLAQALAAEEMPEQVVLHALGPPAEEATSTRSGPVTAGQVRETAARLAPFLRGGVPAYVEVGEQTLTAGELLAAMAWVLQNEPTDETEVPLVTPRSANPYAEDLGWGSSGR